ncbi:MAG: hypothetical protein ACHQ6T_17445 [Myxococcota bacterium]
MPAALERPFRKPGVRLADFPDKVAVEFSCATQKLPWFKVETLEVWPKRLAAGKELGYRLTYVLCTQGATEVVTGKLETRISFRGQAILREPDSAYDLRPGRWVVDVFVTVPATAEDGLYALELEFKSPAVKFARSETFAVEAAEK